MEAYFWVTRGLERVGVAALLDWGRCARAARRVRWRPIEVPLPSPAWGPTQRRRKIPFHRPRRAPNPGPGSRTVWVHGASIGEGLCVRGLVSRLLAADTRSFVVMTCSSASALEVLPTRFPASLRERMRFGLAPLDFPGAVDAFVGAWDPQLAIWVESELWPNSIRAVRSRGGRIVLVNGRLSDRTLRRWSATAVSARLLSETLASFHHICAQTEADADNFASVHGVPRRPRAYDLKAHSRIFGVGGGRTTHGDGVGVVGQVVARFLGGHTSMQRRAWVVGSSHPGEELVIAMAHARIAAQPGFEDWVTLLAPRHTARAGEVQRLLERHLDVPVFRLRALLDANDANAGEAKFGVVPKEVRSEEDGTKSSRLTAGASKEAEGEEIRPHLGSCVVLVDTLGHLDELFGHVEVAFVGGSLPGSALHGRHNVYEPIHRGCSLVLRGSCSTGPTDAVHVVTCDSPKELQEAICKHMMGASRSLVLQHQQAASAASAAAAAAAAA